MKVSTLTLLAALAATTANAKTVSPDGKLAVDVQCEGGKPTYSITYDGIDFLMPSPLGLNTNAGDFTADLTISKVGEMKTVTDDYSLPNIKRSNVHFEANSQTYTFSSKGQDVMNVTFLVANNDVAFRYQLLEQKRGPLSIVINSEATGFAMPDGTTTFLCPQMGEMTGFARTAPSYETHYTADDTMGKNGWGNGYTFPCLFHNAEKGWMLISETGTDGRYAGCKIQNRGGAMYQVSFPSEKENNGFGSAAVQTGLPSYTPWRTITVGKTLQPIVETTVTWDVLGEVAYKGKAASERYGRGAWSWIIADDASCNFDTQKEYIDFAAKMGWESLLIDAQWDRQIGRDRIAELARYGKTKGVSLYLWYNSNGVWNDAPQTPRNCMGRSRERRQEMAWMKSAGIRGIKVDFFGGDKQCTMQLYEDILHDAEDYGLFVIFHGCTLPRGWERMYPNYVASEAVRASENLRFSQGECDREAMDATFLPFIRNAVGSMDFGGSTLNNHYNKWNQEGKGGGHRITSDVFALATAVLFQSPVQHFAMAPGNLDNAPQWALDFMKNVPTKWDDVKFIEGYPGKYVILARRTGDKWFIVGINGQKDQTVKARLNLDMFQAGDMLNFYSDDAQLNGSLKEVKLNKKRQMDITIPYNGAVVINN